MSDFTRLGFDRLTGNISRAVNKPTGRLTTGDITRGELVTVSFDNDSEASTTVKPRRQGALISDVDLDNMCEIHWTINGTVLNVTLNVSRSGSITFWVF